MYSKAGITSHHGGGGGEVASGPARSAPSPGPAPCRLVDPVLPDTVCTSSLPWRQTGDPTGLRPRAVSLSRNGSLPCTCFPLFSA